MFHVKYTEVCSPKVKSFTSKEKAAAFVANFFLKHQFHNTDDNWIDMVFEGSIGYIDPHTPHEQVDE